MGLFSKKKFADTIYMNGNIYINDPDCPYVDAVAVYDGEILEVGYYEDMEALEGKNTEVIDLEGKYLYPGFIDCHRSVVMTALSDMISEKPFELTDDEAVTEDNFDDVMDDDPMELTPEEQAEQDAREEAFLMATEEKFDARINQLLDAGFTTVLDLKTPDNLEQLFTDYLMDQYNEDLMKLRFFGALYVNIAVKPEAVNYMLMQRKTNLLEMDNTMNAEHMYLELDCENSQQPFTEDSLTDMLLFVADRGFKFYVDCKSYEDLKLGYAGYEFIRSKGYKNTYVIASDYELTEDDKANSIFWADVIKTWGVDAQAMNSIYGKDVHGMEQRLDELTINAARMLGLEDELGSIEIGKLADFVIYNEDLLTLGSKPDCGELHAEMTVLNGKKVYNNV